MVDYVREGDRARARRAMERWLVVAPEDAPSLYAAALFYDESGDLDRAVALAVRARRAAPTSPALTAYEGALRWRRGERAEAERLRRAADAMGPEPP